LKRKEHEDIFETGIQVVTKTGSLRPQSLPTCEDITASWETPQGTPGWSIPPTLCFRPFHTL